MDFEQYQKLSEKTAINPNKDNDWVYPALGLVGEAGEVAEKMKRVLREKGNQIDEETRAAIKKELGDVLWYTARLSPVLNLSLNDIAEENINKLTSRKNRNTLKGTGDNR